MMTVLGNEFRGQQDSSIDDVDIMGWRILCGRQIQDFAVSQTKAGSVFGAFDRTVFNPALGKRVVAVRAAVIERVDTVFGTKHGDGLATGYVVANVHALFEREIVFCAYINTCHICLQYQLRLPSLPRPLHVSAVELTIVRNAAGPRRTLPRPW